MEGALTEGGVLSQGRSSLAAHLLCLRRQLSPTVLSTTKQGLYQNVSSQPRSPYKPSFTKTPPLSLRPHHADHVALFPRVFGLVVDCCRSSHSTASASNRPRLLLSSSIDRSAIHRLTSSRIVTHPRFSQPAHSVHLKTVSLLILLHLCFGASRVTCEWRPQQQRASSAPRNSQLLDTHRSQHHHHADAIKLMRQSWSRTSSRHTLLTTRRAL